MRGYPCSGKSIEAQCVAKEERAVVVSRDALRTMLFGPEYVVGQTIDNGMSRETFVTEAELTLVRKALSLKQSVVVDDMNLTKRQMVSLAFEAVKFDVEFEIFDVTVGVEGCVRRAKASGSRHTEEAIRALAERHPIESWPSIDSILSGAEKAYRRAYPKKARERRIA